MCTQPCLLPPSGALPALGYQFSVQSINHCARLSLSAFQGCLPLLNKPARGRCSGRRFRRLSGRFSSLRDCAGRGVGDAWQSDDSVRTSVASRAHLAPPRSPSSPLRRSGYTRRLRRIVFAFAPMQNTAPFLSLCRSVGFSNGMRVRHRAAPIPFETRPAGPVAREVHWVWSCPKR